MTMAKYDTGATRDSDDNKLDFEGFLSPIALERFAQYMHKHRQTEAGLRDSDNWQKGIPIKRYVKSLWRHFFDVWKTHRRPDYVGQADDLEEQLCGVLFNAQGLLHTLVAARLACRTHCEPEKPLVVFDTKLDGFYRQACGDEMEVVGDRYFWRKIGGAKYGRVLGFPLSKYMHEGKKFPHGLTKFDTEPTA